MRIKESSIHCHPDDHVQRFTTVPVQNPVKLVAFRHLANCQGQPVSQLKPEKKRKCWLLQTVARLRGAAGE